MKNLYFDNAATTFPKPNEVVNEVHTAITEFGVNAGRGSYALSRYAKEKIEKCRASLTELAGLSETHQLIFSPSATIALNQIILGIETNSFSNIFISPFEHNSVLRPVEELCKRHNIKFELLPFGSDLEFDIKKCERSFMQKRPDYVFCTHVSNVTGQILPIEQVADLTRKFGGKLIVDASQGLGGIAYDYRRCMPDFLVFAGHKSLYGPFGVGGFMIKRSLSLRSVIFGGTGTDSLNLDMPEKGYERYEVGSENILAIAGLLSALNWINNEGLQRIEEKERELTNMLVEKLTMINGVRLYLPSELKAHKGIVSFNVQNYKCDQIGMLLDQDYGIAVRTGYHCAALAHDLIESVEYSGTVRASIGYFNNRSDIEMFAKAIQEICEG